VVQYLVITNLVRISRCCWRHQKFYKILRPCRMIFKRAVLYLCRWLSPALETLLRALRTALVIAHSTAGKRRSKNKIKFAVFSLASFFARTQSAINLWASPVVSEFLVLSFGGQRTCRPVEPTVQMDFHLHLLLVTSQTPAEMVTETSSFCWRNAGQGDACTTKPRPVQHFWLCWMDPSLP
jgi:hypothetical protein